MRGGRRESQWLVMRRCLAIVRRALRGPAPRGELLQVAAVEGSGDDGDVEGEAPYVRLEKDLKRIREHLLIDVRYDREAEGYVVGDCWLPLPDLPDEDRATIAWLEETFGHDSPQHDAVHALLGRLRRLLAPERVGEIERQHSTLLVDLGRRDEDRIPRAVWDGLTRALVERRRVEFLYRSPQHEDRTPRRHVVDPWERYFDTALGHYYLHGWCHYADGPRGRREVERYIDYRLGRISDLCLLPDKLPPQPPRGARYEVVYELAPAVARLGVSRQRGIEVVEVERREDGSALVRGRTGNLFWAEQALLHYGASCRVLGGPEMLERMRQVVGRMGEMYGQRE